MLDALCHVLVGHHRLDERRAELMHEQEDERTGNHAADEHLLRAQGVPVVCVTLDRDNDNWEGGRKANTYDPETLRTHDINDSIVIGVLGGDAVYG